MMCPVVDVDGFEVKLTNLDKALWPEGLTKADLVAYYHEVAPYALPYLNGRPAVMGRYPDGIGGESFYQKECPGYAPEWIRTFPVEHDEGRRVVRYIVHQNRATLVWLANQAAIELHAWLSTVDHLQYPDIGVIDLDPAEGSSFDQVLTVALLAREVLAEFGITGFPKTSGATGLHIYIPLEPVHTFSEVTAALKNLAQMITAVCPFATIERVVAKRTGKVYIDYLQNTFGKTMAAPYSVRPRPGAPVSMPITWPDVERGNLVSDQFNLQTVLPLLREGGDTFRGFFERRYRLDGLMETGFLPENLPHWQEMSHSTPKNGSIIQEP
jgi:bifunctional non-homologous end joining protein LigD